MYAEYAAAMTQRYRLGMGCEDTELTFPPQRFETAIPFGDGEDGILVHVPSDRLSSASRDRNWFTCAMRGPDFHRKAAGS